MMAREKANQETRVVVTQPGLRFYSMEGELRGESESFTESLDDQGFQHHFLWR